MVVFDSELKVLYILWEKGDCSAKELSEILKERVGWSKTTTYTVIKKCITKKLIKRIEPNFMCHAVLNIEQVQKLETTQLLERLFSSSKDYLIASLLDDCKLSKGTIDRLRKMIDTME
jgi:predicted transcriptional regulator